MTQFTATKTGLKDQHLEQKPLFEKKYSPVEVEKELISRLYNDGSLYYLSDQKDDAEEGRFKPAWSFISTVFSGGVGQIKEKLQQVCKSDIKQKTKNHPEGTTTWKFFCGENAKEVIVKGTAEDGEMAFTEIDQLVSSNMSKIP